MKHPTFDQLVYVVGFSAMGPVLVAEKNPTLAAFGFGVCMLFYGTLAYLGANNR